MWNTVFPSWRQSLVGGSECCEVGCFGTNSNFEVKGQNRWHSIELSQDGRQLFKSHSRCFTRSETIQSGWIKNWNNKRKKNKKNKKNWNNVRALQKPNCIRIYESGEKVDPTGPRTERPQGRQKKHRQSVLLIYNLVNVKDTLLWSVRGHRGSHKDFISFLFIDLTPLLPPEF